MIIFPCMLTYFGLFGANSCTMYISKIFRFNSIYLDFYIAYYLIFLALVHIYHINLHNSAFYWCFLLLKMSEKEREWGDPEKG